MPVLIMVVLLVLVVLLALVGSHGLMGFVVAVAVGEAVGWTVAKGKYQQLGRKNNPLWSEFWLKFVEDRDRSGWWKVAESFDFPHDFPHLSTPS